MAASEDVDLMQEVQESHRDFWHVFPGYKQHPKTLEIRFVREDGTVCGACWSVSSSDDEIWQNLGLEIQNSLCCNDAISPWCVKGVCEQFYDLLSQKHKTVCPISCVPMITMEEMTHVLEQPSVDPWTVALTTESLCDKKPGTLLLTPQGSDNCLLREPQFLSSRLKALEDTMCNLSVSVNDSFHTFSQRMAACEKNLKNARRRLSALERNKYKDTPGTDKKSA